MYLLIVFQWLLGILVASGVASLSPTRLTDTVTLDGGHGPGDAVWACNAWSGACRGACTAKPAVSKWSYSKVGEVAIEWVHEAGDEIWACSSWNGRCDGVWTVEST